MSGERCESRRCPCQATDPREAVELASKMVGGNAEATFAMLSAHGWRLVKK